MKLETMHQIFVASTIGLAFVLAIRGLALFVSRSATAELPLAIGGLVVGVVAVGYLRKYRAKLRAAQSTNTAATAKDPKGSSET